MSPIANFSTNAFRKDLVRFQFSGSANCMLPEESRIMTTSKVSWQNTSGTQPNGEQIGILEHREYFRYLAGKFSKDT